MAASNAVARKPLRLFMPESPVVPSRCNPLGCKRFAAFFAPIAQNPAAAMKNERHLFVAWRFKRNSAVNIGLEWVSAEIIVAAAAITLRFFENAQGLA
ncbi:MULTISPECIES: hypothetical protein [unclassified Sinorhizobium]|uniref:hypothetical protein n=1 Tax=unclassified Sinorhizobium TaxID=2613772 RepID=UPI0024C27C5F|nr:MULTISPECIES: hypothetical protein [unclassified Sinorhizobium]MDK1375155.1 hypothetical protein [Sinorhizobium sp. 6-70]MDK1480794.1 hypothetical protein [Sinorhizobium sp. 6-117]